MAEAGAKEGFMPAASPLPFMPNEHYRATRSTSRRNEEDAEEYKAILDAGFICRSTTRVW
jgi:hypothetical protein